MSTPPRTHFINIKVALNHKQSLKSEKTGDEANSYMQRFKPYHTFIYMMLLVQCHTLSCLFKSAPFSINNWAVAE